jgi:tetratricopeptide (TPR) repeat protein
MPKSRLKVVSPFSGDGREAEGILTPARAAALSYFDQFWDTFTEGRAAEALTLTEEIADALEPSDEGSHLRLSNARGMALEALGRLEESRMVYLLARPLAARTTNDTYRGDHHHGLAFTLRSMGRYAGAVDSFSIARECYAKVEGEDSARRIAGTDNNLAVTLLRWGKPNVAEGFALKALEAWKRLSLDHLCAEACDTLAQIYAAQGELAKALEQVDIAVEILSARRGHGRALENVRLTRAEIERMVGAR